MLLFSCVIVALSSAINLPGRHLRVPPQQNNTALGVNAQESAASVSASAIRRDRTLTFADRVAYQRTIEEVYWRHRIWPAANADAKPPLDRVMTQAEIEKKVEDYLRDSQALEDYWQRPITSDQLQAEMERIAQHIKQPEVLREIFAALGNDAFVIAECLARPVLAERVITELYAHDERFHGELKRRAEAELRTYVSVRQMRQTSGMYTEMEWIKSDSGKDDSAPTDEKCAEAVKMSSSEWRESVAKLAAQFGSQDIVGQAPRLPNGPSAARAAALQKPAIARVKTGVLSPLQEDDAYYYAVAVMNKGKNRLKLATIAWLKEPLQSWLAKAEAEAPMTMATVSANYTFPVIASPSGGCTDDTWTPTSLTNAPDGRSQHTAVWTGSEMIVWSGFVSGVGYVNTGGRYNPSTDSWTATSTTNAPDGRFYHTAVWTGSEMIVWGGYRGGDDIPLNTGGRYNPSTNSWTATSLTNAPDARAIQTAIWTGSEMIVWGGLGGSDALNTGARYNPSTNSWVVTSTTNAPATRFYHTAVWTGSEMIVWGGDIIGSPPFNTGGRYNPSTNSWTATSLTNAPDARALQTAIWTGSQMIVWGGFFSDGVNQYYFNSGGRYNPGADSWTATSTTNAPEPRYAQTAVWTGSQMIVWGGNGSIHPVLNTGGRYNPSTDSWTATTTTDAPAARWSPHGSVDRQPNDRLGRNRRRTPAADTARSLVPTHTDANAQHPQLRERQQQLPHRHAHLRQPRRRLHANANTNRYGMVRQHQHLSATPRNSYAYSNANTYTNADSMQWEMFTHAEAAPQCECATNSATSFNTAAYCFTERHPSAAAHSAASPHATPDAYRLATANSGTSTVGAAAKRGV